jgi:pimeloyl-ACP methyl ester carboxylesterase
MEVMNFCAGDDRELPRHVDSMRTLISNASKFFRLNLYLTKENWLIQHCRWCVKTEKMTGVCRSLCGERDRMNMPLPKLKRFFLMCLYMALAGCAGNDLAVRRLQSAQLASNANWERILLETNQFSLVSFKPQGKMQVDMLSIYIEGDGLAWIDSSTPSSNPTPIDPIGLKIALRDPTRSAVYLARPCQFAKDNERRNCANRYWTSHRFSPEVISSTDEAVEQLKAITGATKLKLIGYSGGGAVAALVAARRKDVVALVTVTGNLDHALWTSTTRKSALSGSLNAADYFEALKDIPQQHYVGGQDSVINPGIAKSYAARFPSPQPQITVIPSFDHHCCWEAIWPDLVTSNFDLIRPEK